MPPAPSRLTISYGPSRVPGSRGMTYVECQIVFRLRTGMVETMRRKGIPHDVLCGGHVRLVGAVCRFVVAPPGFTEFLQSTRLCDQAGELLELSCAVAQRRCRHAEKVQHREMQIG